MLNNDEFYTNCESCARYKKCKKYIVNEDNAFFEWCESCYKNETAKPLALQSYIMTEKELKTLEDIVNNPDKFMVILPDEEIK